MQQARFGLQERWTKWNCIIQRLRVCHVYCSSLDPQKGCTPLVSTRKEGHMWVAGLVVQGLVHGSISNQRLYASLVALCKKYPIRKFSRSTLQDLLLNPNLTVLKKLSKLWVSSIFPLWKLFSLVICSYCFGRNTWAFNLWSCSRVSQLCTRFLLWLNCDSLAWNGWKHFYRSEQQLWHVVVCALGSMTSFARQVVNTHWGIFFRSQFRCLAHIVKAIGNCKTKFMIYNSS